MSAPAGRLAGKIAIVTGGASGIGLAIVDRFAANGASVHVIDLNPCPSTAAASSQRTDVSIAADVERAVADVLARGPVDILVNSAGVSHIGTIEQTSAADFDRLFAVNVKGTYHCIKAVIGAMAARRSGVIVNLASVAASAGLANRFAYSMTKGAIVTMTYSVARDYVASGIRCVSISPARVHTPFVDGYLEKHYPGREAEMFASLSATQPIGRMGEPREVADLAVYLASDEAAFATGIDYPIDGGFLRAARMTAGGAVPGVRGLRWWIIGLVFLATLINFIDRLTVSILGPVIMEQLRLTNSQFGSITTWFLVAYTASQGLSGRLYDRIGSKRGFTISVLVWSVAASAHAFARGLADLRVLRVVLGLGEAGNWPGAAKVIAEWFPVRERAFAMGIFNSGVAVGNVVAFPLVTWLQLRFGWKTTFLVTGGLGFGWLLLWTRFYDAPERHRALTQSEYALIKEGRAAASRSVAWRQCLAYRQTWAIVLARFLTDPVWWLYITWLPVYLYNVRGFNLKEIGMFGWLPYVTADAGSLLGGYLSGRLIARGWSVDRARKTLIAAAAVFMLAGIPAALTPDRMVALACIACVTFGFQAWINNVQTIPSDVFPGSAVASVAGLGGVGAGLGAILFTMTTGYVVDHYSYVPILLTAAVLPILGTAILFAVGGRIRSVHEG